MKVWYGFTVENWLFLKGKGMLLFCAIPLPAMDSLIETIFNKEFKYAVIAQVILASEENKVNLYYPRRIYVCIYLLRF